MAADCSSRRLRLSRACWVAASSEPASSSTTLESSPPPFADACFSAAVPSDDFDDGGVVGDSRSNASRAAVAAEAADSHSASCRWQAAMLAFRMAIS